MGLFPCGALSEDFRFRQGRAGPGEGKVILKQIVTHTGVLNVEFIIYILI